MKLISIIILLFVSNLVFSQNTSPDSMPTGYDAISFVDSNAEKKVLAKEISEFRPKEFIVNYLIGSANANEIKFETETLASDNSTGIISIAFNCSSVNKKGLILAFFGNNKDKNGNIGSAYAYRFIPLNDAIELLNRIDIVQESHKKYMAADDNVNNIYLEFEDIRFVLYKDGGTKIRVFWNGFEIIWEKSAFAKTKKRLDKWFE